MLVRASSTAVRPLVAPSRLGRGPIELLVVVGTLAVGAGIGLLLGSGTGSGARATELGSLTGPDGTGGDDLGRVDLVDTADERNDTAETRRSVPIPGVPTDEELAALENDPLLAELRALLGSEALLAMVTESDETTAAFLMHLYLGLGDTKSALDLARRTNPPAGTWAQIAAQLSLEGNKVDAAEAYMSALEAAGRFAWEDPISSWALQLAALDPQRGLAFLEEHATGSAADPDDMRLALARSMAETGREEEARTSLLEMVALDRSVAASLKALAQFDPELAESEIRRLLGEGRHPNLYGQLAGLLVDEGRTSEALAAIQEGFDLARTGAGSGPDPSTLFFEAIGLLGGTVDDATIDGWIETSGGGSSLRHQAALTFLGQGDLDRAAPYFEAAWMTQAANEGYLSYLPDSFLEQKKEQVHAWLDSASQVAGTKDEVWGDIGDHYWKIGELEKAENAWNTAHDIDPNDGEWTGKLNQIAAGNPPL
ncbi:Tetratricopeptide repeat protein [Planctomycetes bacterium Pla163]|uniref:Tetratricopeptide repeat protein n=1 Tax=Rohdeia mirabilis TaxID=2528008 RepID=A0A518D135_9BACT|nr:Tetratricopeptide repeat protein [Planctomycetes bacterium Pla163]